MTTGSRGVHVVVPICPEETFDDVRDIARRIAEDDRPKASATWRCSA